MEIIALVLIVGWLVVLYVLVHYVRNREDAPIGTLTLVLVAALAVLTIWAANFCCQTNRIEIQAPANTPVEIYISN